MTMPLTRAEWLEDHVGKPCTKTNLEALEAVYAAVLDGELEIGLDGTIWRLRDTRQKAAITPRRAEAMSSSGALMLRITRDGVRHSALAHRLVWWHFNGPIPEGFTINHKSGDRIDNHPSNLELATQSEQMLHAYRVLGRQKVIVRGERHYMMKITDEQVKEIRIRRRGGELLSSIATDYGVSQGTISCIARKLQRWDV